MKQSNRQQNKNRCWNTMGEINKNVTSKEDSTDYLEKL